jgi:curved DNA-binding protein CbpA
LSEPSDSNVHFETLQVSPTAEPEVIAAAYRALAKKYHPDRSEASDASTRMARINVAFQALRARSGRLTAGDSKVDPCNAAVSRITHERIDPGASLEVILAAITRMMTGLRQQVIDEITSDGLARDVASNLVASALRSLSATTAEARAQRPRRGSGVRLDATTPYDEAVQQVAARAQAAREQLVDDLVRDGLTRNAALELAELGFEHTQRATRNTTSTEVRLTAERVDLNASLDKGVRVAAGKLEAATQAVVDEMVRDGVPLRTAEQLVDAAKEAFANESGR